MILSYNWQILQQPIDSQEGLMDIAKKHRPKAEEPLNVHINVQQEPSLSINPVVLKCPTFGFLFCYSIESPKHNPPELQLLPEITLFEEQIRFKVNSKIHTPSYLYLQLQIENNEIYDSLMNLSVKVRYHSQSKLPGIGSVEQLVRMAGQRQINLYTATTYATIKRQIVLQSPVLVYWRQEKDSYMYCKLTRTEESCEHVEIVQVEVMNWLASNQRIRPWQVKNIVNKRFTLAAKESYGLAFTTEGSLAGEEIPYYLKYRWLPSQRVYKMVKHIGIFDYKE